jgi:hypothetical protein
MVQTAAVEDLLNALTDHLLVCLPARRNCDQTLLHTRAWLREHCPSQEVEVLAFLTQSEHACDCQVLDAALAVPDPFLAGAADGPVGLWMAEPATASPARRSAARTPLGCRVRRAEAELRNSSSLFPMPHGALRLPQSPRARPCRVRSGAPLWQGEV